MEMDWIRRDGSVDDLTDHSALIVSGQVESTRFDVIRAWGATTPSRCLVPPFLLTPNTSSASSKKHGPPHLSTTLT